MVAGRRPVGVLSSQAQPPARNADWEMRRLGDAVQVHTPDGQVGLEETIPEAQWPKHWCLKKLARAASDHATPHPMP